jgi:hypothetical protein
MCSPAKAGSASNLFRIPSPRRVADKSFFEAVLQLQFERLSSANWAAISAASLFARRRTFPATSSDERVLAFPHLCRRLTGQIKATSRNTGAIQDIVST